MFNLKVTTNEENYKIVVIKRAITTCWFLLAICFIIKLFGGNFFNIFCSDEKVVKFCNYIDNSKFYYLVAYVNYIGAGIIYTIAITGDNKHIGISSLALSVCYLGKFINLYVGLIIDYVFYIMIFCPLICVKDGFTFKKAYLRSTIGLILINLFQIISLFVKGLGVFKITNSSSLIQIIYNIDYFIMLILYMLYSKKIKRR